MTTTTTDSAVARIAGHLADRDAFVIAAPPATLDELSERLTVIPNWTAYLDNGNGMVLSTSHPAALYITRLLAPIHPMIAIVIVPKTVPAATLTAALDQEVPADGSRDVLLLHDGDATPITWPLLFIDALAHVDPKAAAMIRANDLGSLS